MTRITFKHIIGVTLLFSFNLIIWYSVKYVIPSENRELVIHTLGNLEGYIGAMMMYYYGNSAGQKRLTEMQNEQLKNKNNRPSTGDTNIDSVNISN